MTDTNALPNGYRLNEYEIVRELGEGGFGITYLGYDHNLDKPIAVKEYLPSELASRGSGHTVVPRSAARKTDFTWGLERFLDEARMLARFDHPHIIRVHRFFEAHGTGYIVMEYAEGETLSELLKTKKRLTEGELAPMLLPILEGLEKVHAADVLHRDIKPGNIVVRGAGNAVLIDFGAARQAIGARSRSVTSIVTPGYAPIEQYSSKGHQGPWTDIYALGAVAYRAVTGRDPDDATDRIRQDPLVPAVVAGKGQGSEAFLAAIDWAMAVDERERPQTIAQWRAAFETPVNRAPSSPVSRRPTTAVASSPAVAPVRSTASRSVVIGLVVMCALGGGAWWWAQQPVATHSKPWKIGAESAPVTQQALLTRASEFAEQISTALYNAGAAFDAFARDPEVVAALTGDPSARLAVAEQLASQVPGTLRLRLVPAGPAEPDASQQPPLTYASIDLLRQAAAQEHPVNAEFHIGGTPNAHIALVRRVPPVGEPVGYLHIALDPKLIADVIGSLDSKGLQVEVRQSFPGAPPLVLAKQGEAVDGDIDTAQVAIPGTTWHLVLRNGGSVLNEHDDSDALDAKADHTKRERVIALSSEVDSLLARIESLGPEYEAQLKGLRARVEPQISTLEGKMAKEKDAIERESLMKILIDLQQSVGLIEAEAGLTRQWITNSESLGQLKRQNAIAKNRLHELDYIGAEPLLHDVRLGVRQVLEKQASIGRSLRAFDALDDYAWMIESRLKSFELKLPIVDSFLKKLPLDAAIEAGEFERAEALVGQARQLYNDSVRRALTSRQEALRERAKGFALKKNSLAAKEALDDADKLEEMRQTLE